MQPPELSHNAPTGFIEMHGVWSCRQFFFSGLVDWLNLLRNLGASLHDGCFTYGVTIQRFHDLYRALQGHKLILVEIHQLRLQARTILHRLCDIFRKLPNCLLLTYRTDFDLSLMFFHLNAHLWHFKYLPLFMPLNIHFGQRSVTVIAFLHPVYFNLVRVCYCFQRMPFVPLLSTTFLPAGSAQTSRFFL